MPCRNIGDGIPGGLWTDVVRKEGRGAGSPRRRGCDGLRRRAVRESLNLNVVSFKLLGLLAVLKRKLDGRTQQYVFE